MIEETIWAERYRPKTIDECILPEKTKEEFKQYVKNADFPNLIMSGPAGIGKTTLAKALVTEIGGDFIVINASMNGNIDTLRNDIQSFASSISFSGGIKAVIFDEADYLTPNTQAALRGFMQEFSKNCRFIFTCNFKNRILEPIRESRCVDVNFKISREQRPELAKQFVIRACKILDENNIDYDKKAVGAVVLKYFPDFRKVLVELQRYAVHGQIDSGILSNLSEQGMKQLIGYLANKEFTNMRKWVAENHTGDSIELFRQLYDTAHYYMDKASVPQLVLIISKYQYQEAFVADKEINLAACLTELMIECRFTNV